MEASWSVPGVGTEVHDRGYDRDQPVRYSPDVEGHCFASLWDLAEFSTCPAYSNAS